MDRLFKNVKSISAQDRGFGNTLMHFKYSVNEDDIDTTVDITMRNGIRPPRFKTIKKESENFVNGFKVVLITNGEYAYIRESDNTLLPYRYDVATDFNEYGYAMVGKDGKVSWINKDFEYLNSEGKMVKEHINEDPPRGFVENVNDIYTPFNGWVRVQAFNNGKNPLSLLWNGTALIDRGYDYHFFGPDGKLKEFYKYDGEVDKEYKRKSFVLRKDFNEKGKALKKEYKQNK